MYVLEHCRLYGAKWSLNGDKPVAEQMNRRQSRYPESTKREALRAKNMI